MFIHGTTKAHPTLPCGAHPDEFARVTKATLRVGTQRVLDEAVSTIDALCNAVVTQDRHYCGHDGGMLMALMMGQAMILFTAEMAAQSRCALASSKTGIGSDKTREQMNNMVYALTSAIEEAWTTSEREVPAVRAQHGTGAADAKERVEKRTVELAANWADTVIALYNGR